LKKFRGYAGNQEIFCYLEAQSFITVLKKARHRSQYRSSPHCLTWL